MLLLTIGIIFVLFVLSYLIFDRDILCPPTVVCLSLLFGSLCTLYNEKRWALELSFKTTEVIVIGIGCFMIGGLIALLTTSVLRKNQLGFSHNTSKVEPIRVDAIKTLVVIAVQLIVMLFLYREEKRITGGSSWMTVVSTWRVLTTTEENLNNLTIRLSPFLRLFLQINLAFGFSYIYIVGNNFAARCRQRILDWIPVLLCVALTFLQGYRGDMIRMWVMLLVITITLRKRSTGWKSNAETKKMIKRLGLSVLIVAAVFVIFRGAVGRDSTKDPLYYVTFYAGCPIAGLDQYLKNSHAVSSIWGKETFYDLNQTLRVITKNSGLRYIFYKEFIKSPNGTFIGNVYTAFRPPYADFGGMRGEAIYMIISGLFFTSLYSFVREKRGKNPIDMWLLAYAYMSYTFFMSFYNLYNNFLSHMFLRLMIEILIIRWLLTNVKLAKNYNVQVKLK